MAGKPELKKGPHELGTMGGGGGGNRKWMEFGGGRQVGDPTEKMDKERGFFEKRKPANGGKARETAAVKKSTEQGTPQISCYGVTRERRSLFKYG